MSILKTVFIFALVLAVASARSRQRQRGRSAHRQRGRQIVSEEQDLAGPSPNCTPDGSCTYPAIPRATYEDSPPMESIVSDEAQPVGGSPVYPPFDDPVAVSEAAETPAAEENNAVIEDALSAATEQKEVLEDHEALSAPEAAEASAALQENLNEAIAVAAEQPQYLEVQPQVVVANTAEYHMDMEKAMKLAKRHQKALSKYGNTMPPEEKAEHFKALQKYLELALHYSEQHSIAVQEEKAIDAGAAPEEVAEIAPAVIAGRRMSGRAAAKECPTWWPACGGPIGR